jgi:hypothetical protein
MTRPDGSWRVVFANETAAETFLSKRGFSVGRKQGPERRGILLGDFDIQKWRNLRPADKASLHGVLQRTGFERDSTAAVTIFGAAPLEAHTAIRIVLTENERDLARKGKAA